MTKVKICGIQTVDDALSSIEAGADFIGLNFVRSSHRRVDFETASEIVNFVRDQQKGDRPKIVGVFKDQSYPYVNLIADNLKLDFVQLHGEESLEYCALMTVAVIKVFSLTNKFDLEKTYQNMKRYSVAHYLVDREIQGQGTHLNINKIKELAQMIPFFLAGGLTPEKIKSISLVVKPYAVDVASGVETDGNIDKNKVSAFISNI